MFTRKQTRALKIGSVDLGGGAPVSVQTMANADPHDAQALVRQAVACAEAGADLFRLTVPDIEAAKILGEVRRMVSIPLVADIHFDWRCALAAIEAGTDALRINPGNIGGKERVRAVARAAGEKRVPIRIGVNLGSIEKGLPRTPEGLVDSALRHLKLLEDEGFRDVAISAKASNVSDTIAAYRMLAEKTDCPLHVGVTEAGTFLPGTVRSAVALGVLLEEGIGDTIRVSLTDDPVKEVRVGVEILRALGLRERGAAVTSCPTCGRTKVDVKVVAEAVEAELSKMRFKGGVPRVAVMGCAVNGPGEAKDADVALCGGDGEFLIYVKGKHAAKVSQADAVKKVIEYVVSIS
ncbi:MAG: flavodoxin-dependent (E)-4-hydroxy-3-methylbut-2-enyl-diphosphate synthase [Kiritimatiellae bacterium]|nr:flavodoxin-dependent (E)-4-hydroxy-3-methylbut-2-enyl-diphosphate synthase [Kiritimatiellia bacterium]